MRFFKGLPAFLSLFLLYPERTFAQTYRCWDDHPTLGGKQILPGRCFPWPAAGDPIPEDVRMASYVRCRVYLGGADEYTNNCCEHLTNADASFLKVCSGRQNPPQGLDLALRTMNITNKSLLLCQKIDCGYFEEW